ISLTIRANAVAEAGQLIVSIEIENRGDEPALALVPALELVGEIVRGEVSDQIEPGHLIEKRLAVTMPSDRTGRWPYTVFVDYTDRNGYPAQAVHVGLASIGDPPAPSITAKWLQLPAVLGQGTARLELGNLGDIERIPSLRVIPPRELSAAVLVGPPAVPASGTVIVDVTIENRSALAGSRYPIHALVELDERSIHQTVVASGTIEIADEPPMLAENRWLLWSCALALLCWWSFLVIAGRYQRSSAIDGVPAFKPHPSAQLGTDAFVLLVTITFLASYFPQRLLLSPTTTAGGDMASHVYSAIYLREVLLPAGQVSGWFPGNYCGFPIFQFYFPLAFLAMAAASLVVPMLVAFKLGTVLGTFFLPLGAYLGLRMAGSPFPGPALGALSTLPFLFMDSNSVWGGNLPSTLSGEFAYSLGLALAIPALGFIHRALVRRAGVALSALWVAAVGFAHGYPLLWLGMTTLALLASPRFWMERLAALTAIHGLAFLLLGAWLVPLLWFSPWTTPYADAWGFREWKEVLPPILWPAAAGVAGAVVLRALSPRLRDPSAMAAAGIWWAAIPAATALYLLAPALGVVDIRFLPFLQVALGLVAAVEMGGVLSRMRAPGIWPIAILLALLPWLAARQSYVSDWIEWNYSGFEAKPGWRQLQRLSEHLRGDFRDPRVVFEHSDDHEALGTTRAFESLPLFSGRSTLEGLYMQASPVAPFVFFVQSEVSRVGSCPFPAWGCASLDLDRAITHLRMLAVSQLILRSDEAKQAAARHPGLAREISAGPYQIHRIVAADGRYAVPLTERPRVLPLRGWKEAAYRWFKRAKTLEPVPVFTDRRLAVDLLSTPPDLVEEIDRERIVVRGCRPGHPILIRIGYHPRWRVTGAETIHLAGPGFMLVVPEGELVELHYEATPPVLLGQSLSVLGLAGLAAAAWGHRRLRRSQSSAIARGPLDPTSRRSRIGIAILASLLAVAVLAISLFERAEDPQRLFDLVRERERAGDLEGVMAIVDRIRHRAPLSGITRDASHLEAMMLYRDGRWREAAEYFARFLEDFPESSEADDVRRHLEIARERLGEAPG
ncbi:MAG: 6-pyruvoyl-tetrahydropterin synthase-related protein, partial [Gammaproteobacteria bacterium]